MWEVSPGVDRRDWADEHHAAAVGVTFDLLEGYFAEQSYVAE